MLLLPLSKPSALILGLGLAFGFLDGVVFFGCEATRPLFSGVPVMKTRSLSYPSQVLPLLMQFWQNGRSLLHFTLRLRQVSQPLYLPGTPTILSVFVLSAFVCMRMYACICRPGFGPWSLCMCVCACGLACVGKGNTCSSAVPERTYN